MAFYAIDLFCGAGGCSELIYESYVEEGEEQILGKRFASILKLLDQLSDKDLEDFIWIVKQRIAGKL